MSGKRCWFKGMDARVPMSGMRHCEILIEMPGATGFLVPEDDIPSTLAELGVLGSYDNPNEFDETKFENKELQRQFISKGDGVLFYCTEKDVTINLIVTREEKGLKKRLLEIKAELYRENQRCDLLLKLFKIIAPNGDLETYIKSYENRHRVMSVLAELPYMETNPCA